MSIIEHLVLRDRIDDLDKVRRVLSEQSVHEALERRRAPRDRIWRRPMTMASRTASRVLGRFFNSLTALSRVRPGSMWRAIFATAALARARTVA